MKILKIILIINAVIFGVVFLAAFFITYIVLEYGDPEKEWLTPTVETTTQPIENVTYKDFNASFDDTMTEAAKAKVFTERYKGKTVQWTGTVFNVLGDIAFIDMKDKGVFYDLVVRFDDDISGLRREQKITFEATISDFGFMAPMTLTHGRLIYD